MARFYEFSVVRFSSNDARDERLNVGLVVFKDDAIDLRVSKRLEKIRAMSAAVDADTLREVLGSIAALQTRAAADRQIAAAMQIGRFGPISLSERGTFEAHDESAYESRIAALVRNLVDPEPSAPKARDKRSRLLTNVKGLLRRERLLARKGEDLASHRIVPRFALQDGLVADLALKNGSMHVVETVDASGSEDQVRRAVSEIGVAALVLESARMKFGETGTKTRIVYEASSALERVIKPSLEAAEHQGAELINWDSKLEREQFLNAMAALAIPAPLNRTKRSGSARFG
jgi:hypothetical protein